MNPIAIATDNELLGFLNENMFWLVGGSIAIVAITFGSLTGMLKSRTRERTRREIAAYIAEGSMTPEQGERLMKAGEEED